MPWAKRRLSRASVTYLVFPDEGHGFYRPQNNIAFHAIVEAFLARHLGGGIEPVGGDVEGSSHDIRAGADIIEDLGVRTRRGRISGHGRPVAHSLVRRTETARCSSWLSKRTPR